VRYQAVVLRLAEAAPAVEATLATGPPVGVSESRGA